MYLLRGHSQILDFGNHGGRDTGLKGFFGKGFSLKQVLGLNIIDLMSRDQNRNGHVIVMIHNVLYLFRIHFAPTPYSIYT